MYVTVLKKLLTVAIVVMLLTFLTEKREIIRF